MTNCDQKSNLHEDENTLLTVSLRKFLQVLIAEKVHQTYSMEFIPQNVTDETHTHWEHLFVYCYTQAFILHMILHVLFHSCFQPTCPFVRVRR